MRPRGSRDLVTLAVDSGLGIDGVEGGVDARPRNGSLGIETLVEDAREHRRKSSTQPRCARGADCEREALAVERETRRHAALEVVARLRIAVRDVRLAEEVVQLHVQIGEPDTRAHTE